MIIYDDMTVYVTFLVMVIPPLERGILMNLSPDPTISSPRMKHCVHGGLLNFAHCVYAL